MSEVVEPKMLRGLKVGRVCVEPLVRERPQKKPEQSEAIYSALVRMFDAYSELKVTVRRQSRRALQKHRMTIHALEKQLSDLQDPVDGRAEHVRDAPAIAALLDAIAAAVREMLLEHVIEPKTGADLGAMLIGVQGPAEIEGEAGSWISIGMVTDVADLVEHLDELDLLELAGQAAIRAQEPTRDQGN